MKKNQKKCPDAFAKQKSVSIIKAHSFELDASGGLIAQSVEHRPFKAVVLGSSPSQPTIFLYIQVGFTENGDEQ